MRHLILSLSLIFSAGLLFQSCGDSKEDNPEQQLSGEYTASTVIVNEIELPNNYGISLSLNEDNNYISSGLDKIDATIDSTGKWSLDSENKKLSLNGMNFDLLKFEENQLKISCKSETVDFQIEFKKTTE